MTIEQEFFEAFGIKPNVRNFEQYNYGQVKRGLEIYKEAEKLEKQGVIKITHRMLNARPENDCVYWEELHYQEITPEIVLKLINIILKARGEFRIIGSFSKIEVLMKNVLQVCISIAPEIQDQVKALFKC